MRSAENFFYVSEPNRASNIVPIKNCLPEQKLVIGKIYLKISPLPREWKRKNILNAFKRRRKFQNQKGPQSGRDLSVDPGAVPRVKSPPAEG